MSLVFLKKKMGGGGVWCGEFYKAFQVSFLCEREP